MRFFGWSWQSISGSPFPGVKASLAQSSDPFPSRPLANPRGKKHSLLLTASSRHPGKEGRKEGRTQGAWRSNGTEPGTETKEARDQVLDRLPDRGFIQRLGGGPPSRSVACLGSDDTREATSLAPFLIEKRNQHENKQPKGVLHAGKQKDYRETVHSQTPKIRCKTS